MIKREGSANVPVGVTNRIVQVAIIRTTVRTIVRITAEQGEASRISKPILLICRVQFTTLCGDVAIINQRQYATDVLEQ